MGKANILDIGKGTIAKMEALVNHMELLIAEGQKYGPDGQVREAFPAANVAFELSMRQ